MDRIRARPKTIYEGIRMKSGSKLDPDEQSRHRQLINVTNTW